MAEKRNEKGKKLSFGTQIDANDNAPKDSLSRGITRRQAIGKGALVGAAAAGLIIGGAATYLATGAGAGPRTLTETLTQTLTQTVTSSVAGSTSVTSSPVSERDYYYDPSLSGTTINWIASPQPDLTLLEPILSQFTADTGITVNVGTFPEGTVESKVMLMFSAKSNQYDLMDCTGFGSYAYAFNLNGWVEDLAPYIAKTPSWNANDITPIVMSRMKTAEGVIHSLPSFCADWPYFYRKDVLPQPASTIDEMIAYAKKVHDPPNLFGYCACGTPDIFSVFPWEMFLWAYGGRWFDESYLPQFNTEAAYNATKSMYELSKYAPKWTSTDMGGVQVTMMEGKAAQATDFWSFWYPMAYGKDSAVIGKLGFAPHPGVVSQPHMLAGITRAISKYSTKKDAAWSFLSWLTSPTMQSKLFGLGMGSAIRQSILSNPDLEKADPDAFSMLSWLKNAGNPGSGAPVVAEAIFPFAPRVSDLVAILVTNLGNVYSGSVDYKTAMDLAQTQATQFMKEVGLYKG